MTDLSAWIGRKRIEHDVAAVGQAQAMTALLDGDPQALVIGSPLPEFWHWIYFNAAVPRSQLGVDGHERRGEFLPPVQLPRRMWAGGRVRFLRPIALGQKIRRESEIVSIDRKHGRSGELVLVSVRHTIHDSEGICVQEEQDLVYCEIARAGGALPPPVPSEIDWREQFLPDAVTLFRYSALTFNAHRIHYDHRFTTETEGYRAVVVHGPLTALLLLEAAKRHGHRAPQAYRYRGRAPLFVDEPITLAGKAGDGEIMLWATGPQGTIAMEASVIWADD